METKPTVKIQKIIFRTMLMMASILIATVATVSVVFNVMSEHQAIDGNLKNVAGTIASSEFVSEEILDADNREKHASDYLDNLKKSLSNVDVISVISSDGTRCYHTNSELIGTIYDGTMPDFETNGITYLTSDVGPSGSQRRAYSAVYDKDGNYIGFVLVVMLNSNIYKIVGKTVSIHLIVALAAILICALLSNSLSKNIKSRLHGYEPDTFSDMYSVRDTIIESLNEGVIAVNQNNKILFMNTIAGKLVGDIDSLPEKYVTTVLKAGESILSINTKTEKGIDILVSYYPINEDGETVGVLCVLVDRSEHTKMLEDITGVRYLVDSMRANNHDFTNKLHVILGLIQMGNYDKACSYISDVTMTKQIQLSNIMRSIDEPAIAALLIGKQARAAELDIVFALEKGSKMQSNMNFPLGDLITIIGNLIENSMDAINTCNCSVKNITVGVFGEGESLLIKIDDSGPGIPEELMPILFDKGVTTKGENRGTGLYVVKKLVDKLGGTITVESEVGEGTLISVWLSDGGNKSV